MILASWAGETGQFWGELVSKYPFSHDAQQQHSGLGVSCLCKSCWAGAFLILLLWQLYNCILSLYFWNRSRICFPLFSSCANGQLLIMRLNAFAQLGFVYAFEFQPSYLSPIALISIPYLNKNWGRKKWKYYRILKAMCVNRNVQECFRKLMAKAAHAAFGKLQFPSEIRFLKCGSSL